MGSLRNPMWSMQKQSASFIAVEVHIWLEACQETKNGVSDAFAFGFTGEHFQLVNSD